LSQTKLGRTSTVEKEIVAEEYQILIIIPTIITGN
jgi:hypothetical protein